MRKRLVGLLAVLSVALAGAWVPAARADVSTVTDATVLSGQSLAPQTQTADRSSWG